MAVIQEKININAEVLSDSNKKFLFLLHGFTGSSEDWKEVAENFSKDYSIIAIDLIGHGKSSSPEDPVYYSPDDISAQLFQIIRSFTVQKAALLGYSMGGRAALNFAVRFPGQLSSLIIEGTSAGIRVEKERSERIIKDYELADFIEKNSIEAFVDYWMNLEIFSTQKRFSNTKLKQIRESKILNNNTTGLANSLRGFSSGIMPPLYNKLKIIKVPTLLITGELDSKFTMLNEKMLPLFNNAKHVIIKNAGHNTHLEEPGRFVKSINQFLKVLD